MSTLKQIASAIAALFGFLTKKRTDENTPEVKASVSARKEQEIVDDFSGAVERGDLDKIREGLAE